MDGHKTSETVTHEDRHSCFTCQELKKSLVRILKENADLKERMRNIQEKNDHDGLIHSMRLITLEEQLKKLSIISEAHTNTRVENANCSIS